MSSLPRGARRSLLVYNLCFPFVLVALLPGYLARMMRRGNFRAHFGQRLGRFTQIERAQFQGSRWIWVHSISVGETFIALKLARELRRQDPALKVALSVTTSTGFDLAKNTAGDGVTVIYNPIDAQSFVRATLDVVQPEQLILIEGEAWPNLLAECRARRVPTAMVNARLSPRSERRMQTARFWISPIFQMLGLICVPEESDLARWIGLGIDPKRLQVTGSIKFDAGAVSMRSRESEFRELLVRLGIPPTAQILLAGSTWEPEERMLVEIYRALRPAFPELFLIIVPRHVERSEAILRELSNLRLNIVRRSSISVLSAPDSRADVLLVDTTGELLDWYRLATVVFVGKSMEGIREVGGQNPAEPAALGKPVIFGPHMENFAGLVEQLLKHHAAISVIHTEELRNSIIDFLRSPTRCASFAANAQRCLEPHRGATERTVHSLKSLLDLKEIPEPISGLGYLKRTN